MNYDIEALVENCRESKTFFANGYKPTFDIHTNYSTSGQIFLLDKERLYFGEISRAMISFITPEVYPKSLWVGKKIVFKEGNKITGYATVVQIYNKLLESENNQEGCLKMK